MESECRIKAADLLDDFELCLTEDEVYSEEEIESENEDPKLNRGSYRKRIQLGPGLGRQIKAARQHRLVQGDPGPEAHISEAQKATRANPVSCHGGRLSPAPDFLSSRKSGFPAN